MKTNSVLEKMPVLQRASELYGDVDFSNTALIACQHLFRTNRATVELFQKQGLSPRNIYIIGKAYSASQAGKRFWSEISNVYEWAYDSHQSHDSQLRNHTKRFLSSLEKPLAEIEKIVVMDDGGCLLKNVAEYFNPDLLRGVEQTSSGYNILRREPLKFPIANVARSKAKLEYETPHIVDYFLSCLDSRLKYYNVKPANVLLLGEGVIGTRIANKLRESTNVVTSESLDETKKEYDLKSFDLVIGASGATSVNASDYSQFSNAYFVSVSSSDREFDSVHFRRNSPKGSAHDDYKCDSNVLLNAGHPLTFWNEAVDGHPDPSKMDITMAMMYSGVQEILNKTVNGFHEVPRSVQDELIDLYVGNLK